MKKFWSILILGIVMSCVWSSMAFAASQIEGDIIDYDFRSGQATAKGHVVLTRDDSIVKAKDGDYNTKTEAGKLTGGVVATQPDGKASCNTLILHAGGDQLTAQGNAVLKKKDKTLRADQVEYFQSREYMETVGSWAQLSMDDGSTLDAGYINYDQKSGIANATDRVRIKSEVRKLTASGDKAVYNTKLDDGTIDLIGNATATQDGNTIKGNLLKLKGVGSDVTVSQKDKKQTIEGIGDVKMVYIPKPEPAKAQPGADGKGKTAAPAAKTAMA